MSDSNLFISNLPKGMAPKNFVEQRLLTEYGSVFVAQGVAVPTRIVFANEREVSEFQSALPRSLETIGGFSVELQAPAMDALRGALADAHSERLSITPRGADSARRTYEETVGLWASRVEPALEHWVAKGRITVTDAVRISSMSPFEQVDEVLKLEEQGIYFAKDLSKSIVYSVAPPGTSQHLSMLALDVSEYNDDRIRRLLAKHRWFQTVV